MQTFLYHICFKCKRFYDVRFKCKRFFTIFVDTRKAFNISSKTKRITWKWHDHRSLANPGTERKRLRNTRQQEHNQSKATSSLFLNKMTAKLKMTQRTIINTVMLLTSMFTRGLHFELCCSFKKNKLEQQSNTRCLPLTFTLGSNDAQYPSTSRHQCTCKVWSCYAQQFRECIYKKIQYVTFDLELSVKVSRSVAQYTLHHVTYSPAKVWNCYVQQFRRRCIFKKNTLVDLDLQGHMKRRPVHFTSYDICIYDVWSCYVKQFWRRCIYKKIYYLTLNLRPMSFIVLPSTLTIMCPM